MHLIPLKEGQFTPAKCGQSYWHFQSECQNFKITESLSYRSPGLAKKHPDEAGQVVFGRARTVEGKV
jgi:hypothetical protein